MRIFIGSSKEAKKTMEEVRHWLDSSHRVIPWTSTEAFPLESSVFERLIDLSESVDAAVFIISEDDLSSIRGTQHWQVRDNVLFEYGLFLGALGRANVRRIIVGNPKQTSNMLGIIGLRIPKFKRSKKDRENLDEARIQIIKWASELSPNLQRFGLYLAKFVAKNQRVNVSNILLNKGSDFLKQKSLKEIRALCSDKGGYGEKYYGEQFKWAKRGENRKLKRIFVAGRESEFCEGFGEREVDGILSHLNQNSPHIEAKWISEDFPFLRDAYPSHLGFALFDKNWFVHWSTEAGTFYDHKKMTSDNGIGKLLHHHWKELWRCANEFNSDLFTKLKTRKSAV